MTTRAPLRRVAFSRRDALKLASVSGVVAAGAGIATAGVLRRREQVIAGECRFCTMHCGFLATVQGDDVVRVEGDPASDTRGFLCEHGRALPEVVGSRERLRRPLKRRGDHFVEVSWDEALDEIAARLGALKQKHGPEALAVQTGWPFVRHPMIHLLHRFCRAYGTPNLATVASLCEASGRMGRALVFGANYSPDLAKVRTLLVWGANPPRTAPPWAFMVTNVKKRAKAEGGGALVVIDPVRTEIADHADLYVRIRPGTDAAFALGMARHILSHGLEDKAFVAAHVRGIETLRALAEEWTPVRVAAVTGTEPSDVVKVAELFATQGPSGIYDGLGIEHHAAGVDTVRLVAALVALTGSADAQALHDQPSPTFLDDPVPAILRVEQQEPVPPAPTKMPVGFDEHPLFCAVHRQAQASLLPRAMLEDKPYPIRGLLVFGANPAVTTPDAAMVREAWEKLELLVVAEPFLTESAELADFVLPAASFAEDAPLRVGAGAAENRRVVEPVGRSRPDAEILFDLARRCGLGAYFPWQGMQEALAAPRTAVMEPWLLEKTRPEPDSVSAGAGPPRFPTPTGKVEVESSLLPRFGLPAAPRIELPEALTPEHPLRLVTGPRQRAYINSQFHQIPSIVRLLPEPLVDVHPATAEQWRVRDGAPVAVVTPRGRAMFRARLTDAVSRDVVVVPNGWPGEANGNRLTSLVALDPISGFPRLRSLICRLEPG